MDAGAALPESSTPPLPAVRRARRRFLALGGVILLVACGLLVGLSFYAMQVEPEWLEVHTVDVFLPELSPLHEGLTLVQLTDLHLGPDVTASYLQRVVKQTNAQSPDLIVLTGDFVSQSASYSRAAAEILADLRAPYGVFAVLGNHDVWVGADEVAARLTEVGITVLRNDRVQLFPRGEPLWLVGIEDAGALDCGAGGLEPGLWSEQQAAVTRLLADIPSAEARILLVHAPDFVTLLPAGRLDLVLSGHTHGGQVRLPLMGAPIVPSCEGQKYAGGWVPGSPPVYVSRGIGLIAPAVRFNCRPELPVLRLRRAVE
ncbi:MAG TPA: metallophosphoesterase [Anaerolineae bacterium]|nr:metallophosphoesterase [Anaerolineae bacterium]